jgi:hypothetical protein
MVENPARVSHASGSRCWYTPGHWCSIEKPCDPPSSLSVDCPPALRSSGDADVDDWRPPTRKAWLRVREKLVVSPKVCGYYADCYCPPPHHPTRTDCDPAEFRQVPCLHTPTGARVAPFVARRGSSRCVAYPAFECPLGECVLPPGQPTDCR